MAQGLEGVAAPLARPASRGELREVVRLREVSVREEPALRPLPASEGAAGVAAGAATGAAGSAGAVSAGAVAGAAAGSATTEGAGESSGFSDFIVSSNLIIQGFISPGLVATIPLSLNLLATRVKKLLVVASFLKVVTHQLILDL